MPLYEYRCSECAHLEEVLQKVSDPPPAVCPSCGKEHTLAKEVSLTSFQLKGGGWYKDLYSSSKPATSTESASSEKKSETKSEAKSEAKSTASDTTKSSDKKAAAA